MADARQANNYSLAITAQLSVYGPCVDHVRRRFKGHENSADNEKHLPCIVSLELEGAKLPLYISSPWS